MQPQRITSITFITLLAAAITSFAPTFLTLLPTSLAFVKTPVGYKAEGELPRTLTEDEIQKLPGLRKSLKQIEDDALKDSEQIEEQRQEKRLAQGILEPLLNFFENSENAGADQLLEEGTQQFKVRQFQAALESWRKALKLYQQTSNLAGIVTTLNSIGDVHFSLGENAQALKFYQQALDTPKSKTFIKRILRSHRQKVGEKVGEGTSFNKIGLVYARLGQYSDALKFHRQALAIFKQVGDKAREGATLNNIGEVYTNLGQYSKGLEFYQQALAIYKQVDNKIGEGTRLIGIGNIYMYLSQYPKALESYQQALDIARKLSDKAGELAPLNNIGMVYTSLGRYPKALEFYQQALDIRKQVGDKVGEGTTLSNIGEAYSYLGQYPDAEKTLMNAIQVLESLRPGLTDTDKVSIFETQDHTYRLLQQALTAQKKVDTALEVAERGRARAFVELLATQLSSRSPIQTPFNPPTLKQIQRIARDQNATLVEYSIFPEQLFIWVIKPTGEIAFRKVDLKSLDTSLADLVSSSRDSIGVKGRGITAVPTSTSSQANQLRQLHQLLIQPIAGLLPTDPNAHVIFIPQGELFLVPFPALRDKSGKYLVQKHTILTAPSIQVLSLTRDLKLHGLLHQGQRFDSSGKGSLVVGNPTMPKVEPPLEDLPDAEQEAQAIAPLLQTQAIVGSEASETAIKQQMPQAGMIHLATHGLLDDFKGLGVPGAIALAPSGKDNGLLTASEILDMKLNAELVVLSACDTGRGNITGDGVIGLSRSLISAGVPSVIVSLWSVPDASTAALMTKFYQRLQQNPNRAQALRDAMLTTMRRHPNPREWAAFTLIGEAR